MAADGRARDVRSRYFASTSCNRNNRAKRCAIETQQHTDATASPTGPAQPGKLLRNTVPAPALTGEEKFHDRVGNVVGLRGWLGTAVGAGLGTAFDVPKEWDTHISGYGLRYASGIGVNLTHQAFGFGLDNALHEDPRYFPSEEQGFKPRLERGVLILAGESAINFIQEFVPFTRPASIRHRQ